MLAGNPDKFAFVIERVSDWEKDGCVNGMMYIYINGRAFPRKLHTTKLDADLYYLFDEESSAFVHPRVSRKLCSFGEKKAFKCIRKARYPEFYAHKENAEVDYRYDVTLGELESARYRLFVVTDGQKVRLLLGRWKYKRRREKFRLLETAEISAAEYQDIVRRVYVYYHNNIEPASQRK